AEQKIVVELLHQQPLGSHAIEGLQKQRAQKPLRRNSRPSMPGVELGESPRQAVEHLIDKRADQAQRMVRRYTPFNVNVSEELDRPLVNSAHRAPLDTCESIADMRLGNHIQTVSKTHFFSNLLEGLSRLARWHGLGREINEAPLPRCAPQSQPIRPGMAARRSERRSSSGAAALLHGDRKRYTDRGPRPHAAVGAEPHQEALGTGGGRERVVQK